MILTMVNKSIVKIVLLYVVAILVAVVIRCGLASAQAWRVEGDRLLRDGKPAFLTGVNYLPSKHWLTILRNWDGDVVERDMQAMQSIGVRCIRFFPLWSLCQPQPDKLDPVVLANLDKLIAIAGRHGIQLEIAPLTGFMSGGMYLPKWATGNLFTDNNMIKAEEYYMEEMARRYGSNPNVQAFDLGNESNIMIYGNHFDVTPQQVEQWMGRISGAFRKGAPGGLFTVSPGTGMDRYYTNETLAKNSDFMVVHSYIYWHGTLRLDPWIGQRTLYSSNFMIEWARMTGKPVVVQELGASEEWLPSPDIPGFMRINFLSDWAAGAAGFLWWSSHDIEQNFHIPNDIVMVDRSSWTYQNGRFSELEYALGLFDVENRPKPSAAEFKHCTELVEQLGSDWNDRLPVCYILVPEAHEDFAEIMLRLITPFTLAKQAHFDVKLRYENTPIPKDAAAVVIAGFKLSAAGKQFVGQYLDSGGTVYQSQEQDFAQEQIQTSTWPQEVATPNFLVQRRAGGMSLEERLRVGAKLTIREITSAPKEQIILGQPAAFARAQVGSGTYYFFSGNLEDGLRGAYNPWESDNSNLIYSALRPTGAIDVSSKQVELFHKQKGTEELLMLVNRSNAKQETEVLSTKPVELHDHMSGGLVGEGFRMPISLGPMEVLTLDLKRR
jgi:hypothetical protein